MTYRDNRYCQKHFTAHRTDPTGRHSPLYVQERDREPAWLLWAGTLAFAVLFAVIFFLGV